MTGVSQPTRVRLDCPVPSNSIQIDIWWDLLSVPVADFFKVIFFRKFKMYKKLQIQVFR